MRAFGTKTALLTLHSIGVAALGALAVLLLTAAPAMAAAPPNDDFANREVITGLGTITGSNVDATREFGEPDHLGHSNGASVWYEWTAPGDGSVPKLDIDLAGSSFDTTLAVYTGAPDLASLTWVADNDDDGAAGTLQSRLHFDAVAGQTYYIAVDGYPYVPVATGSIEMTLSLSEPTGIIQGTVTDSGGNPVGQVCVDALDAAGDALTTQATTNASGSYELSEVPVGTGVHVRFRNCNDTADVAGEYFDDAQTLAGAADVSVTEDTITGGIDAVLADGGTMSGTITPADPGDDIADVCVTATMVGGSDDGYTRRGATAADGTWTILGLDGGSYRVQFGEPGACPNNAFIAQYYDGADDPADALLVDVTEGGTVSGIDATLATGPGWIEGTVRDRFLDPLENICVSAESTSASYSSSAVDSDASGHYRIDDLPPAGDYVVTFVDCHTLSGGYTTQYFDQTMYADLASTVTVAAGHGTGLVNASMFHAGSIGGTLTDIDGLPIDNACVNLYSDSDVYLDSTSSDPGGSWTLPAAPGNHKLEFVVCSGEYETRWYHDQTTEAAADLVTVNDGEDVTGIDQVLPDGNVGRIKGHVTDTLGNPVSGVCVGAFTIDPGGDTADGETGADGSYVLRGLDPDDYTVVFGPCDPDGPNLLPQFYLAVDDPAAATPVTVTAGASTTGIDAALRTGGQISGTVTGDFGSHDPVPDICVSAYDATDGSLQGLASTDANGDYTVPALFTGDYHVDFYDCDLEYVEEWYDDSPDEAGALSVHVDEGDTTTGVDAALARYGTISGTWTDENGDPAGDPLGSGSCSAAIAFDLSGTPVSAGFVDEDGHYLIGGLDTGTYDVLFSPCDPSLGQEWYDNAVDQTEAVAVDVTFGLDTPGIDAVLQDTEPANTALPTISGPPVEVGVTLTAGHGAWQHEPSTYAYQWLRCTNGTMTSCTDIAGATAATYDLADDDIGDRIRLRVTATNSIGSGTATSRPTAAVDAPRVLTRPTVSGTAESGSTMTGTDGTWTGSPTSFAYQWRRCTSGTGASCTDIPGANALTYDLTDDDIAFRIRLRVAATNPAGTGTSASAPTAPVNAPRVLTLPAVSGTSANGSTLTGTDGTWTGSPTSFAYQWLRCTGTGASCTTIAGANALTYDLADDDIGFRIRLRVTAANAAGSTAATSKLSAPVDAPRALVGPTVSGITGSGSTLAGTDGTWTGSPTSFAYQWLRCTDGSGASCTAIAGANAATYDVTDDDIAHRVRLRVTATNSAGSTNATSNATAPVNAPRVLSRPTVSGTTESGSTLAGTDGTWTGTPTSYGYQWLRCADGTGASCTPIAGANAATYDLTDDDIGYRIRLRVTATNTAGSATAISNVTAPVNAPRVLTRPTVSGSTESGSTLTGTDGTWTGTPTSYGYQWLRCADGSGASCTPIAGANAATYDLTDDDIGYRIRLRVTATNTAGSTTATSKATAAIADGS